MLRATARHVWRRLRALGPGPAPLAGDWLPGEQVLACAYPRQARDLDSLAAAGVSQVINLHEQPHDPARLHRRGLREVHLPVPDFTPPTPAQLDQAVATIAATLASGERVAVHCGAGLGRTGTVLACYLIQAGIAPDAGAAIATIRRVRPRSVETEAQVAAIAAYAARHASANVPARPAAQR